MDPADNFAFQDPEIGPQRPTVFLAHQSTIRAARAGFNSATTSSPTGRLKCGKARPAFGPVIDVLTKGELPSGWTHQTATWAEKFLDARYTIAMRPGIAPMRKIARLCRRHREPILKWFRAKGAISNGFVEGLNNKATLIIRKLYGLQSSGILEMAIFHVLDKLPESKLTHEFY